MSLPLSGCPTLRLSGLPLVTTPQTFVWIALGHIGGMETTEIHQDNEARQDKLAERKAARLAKRSPVPWIVAAACVVVVFAIGFTIKALA